MALSFLYSFLVHMEQLMEQW